MLNNSVLFHVYAVASEAYWRGGARLIKKKSWHAKKWVWIIQMHCCLSLLQGVEGGGWRLRKFWYTTHLPQLRVDYHWNVWQFSTFQQKKTKNYNNNFLMIVGSLETFSPSGLLFSPKMYFLLLLFLMLDTSNLLSVILIWSIFSIFVYRESK